MRYIAHDYQKYATQFILDHPIAAVFLEMGLGKSVITLTALFDLCLDQFLNPIQQATNGFANGGQHLVGSLDIPIQIADVGLNAAPLHLHHRRPHVNGGDYIQTLPLIGAQVEPLWPLCCFQITVDRVGPSLPPDLCILLVVPVNGILLVAFQLPEGKRMRSPFSSRSYTFRLLGSHLPCSSMARRVSIT